MMNTLTYVDRVLIYFFIHNFRVNLPQSNFNYLRDSIIASRTRHQTFIPFARVLSVLFTRARIIGAICRNGPEDVLEEFQCEFIEV